VNCDVLSPNVHHHFYLMLLLSHPDQHWLTIEITQKDNWTLIDKFQRKMNSGRNGNKKKQI